REMFMEWRKRRIALENNIALLERKRDEYTSATTLEKEAMREEILALERDVEDEQEALVLMERHIRRLEQEELYKIGI
ncbi:MAG: hypothetical protein II249_04350, partial [Bacteroidaceae bacterium]|nr:hypothetical protein [Bacteroidaceae bacterium]